MSLSLGAGAAGLLGRRAWAQAAGGAPPSKPTGQVVIGLSQEPTVFHPLMIAIEVDQGVWWSLYNPLWGVDPDGNFTPQLASEVPSLENGGISADGLMWRIKLRGDVKWHDGAPFTADDVKFSLELNNNPNFRAGRRTGHELIRDVKVVSPTEITWRMERPYAPYMSILAWTFMVPQHLLANASDPNTTPFNNAPVGTGPFRWGERQSGDHITLLANPNYFGKGPYLERATYKYIPDLTVLFTQFRTGDIDYIGIQGITPDHYNEAKGLADRVVSPIAQAFVESITMNLGRPVFQDRAVREALYYAMDKKSIIDEIYYGLPKPTDSYLPKQSWAYNPNLPVQDYNPDKSKQILDAAGWKPGAGGVREKNGLRLEFTNSTTAGNHVREQAQQLLQQNWRDIGAAMTIKNMPAAVIWGDYFSMSKYDSVMVGEDFLVGPDPDVAYYFDSNNVPAKGGAGNNTMQYANPEVDKLLQEGASTPDQAKRKAIYQQVQTIIRNDLPILPIFQYTTVEGTKAKLKGYRPNINTQTNCWNVNEWYWAT
ncbi:peptide ABC transporter substrate-binding protein [Limobrevibacterium gyesilva]|uniref:Peptide ABC transporter substrate-binding protein n=1 Tax=Limobrevibacterium gyesilva TaxID=2991712 RepID=A0AA41YHP9_9PROT|nr:peptide ABC transporter substrate-binding protein [Limobrevibacterium gyesilva]MCW3473594.1 peptide ABC transporter substrate-binding protein [Limobrevibacterium gyesilva]